ncbi:Nitroreductase [Oceanobacillus limi]|uniref:Nitroreductase n=1 Tax=Oceanobacillus limi TaxID=930131 RepID=A0A1I0DS81_9BACI|nr:nitroreductase family protein [Oceanobacillus limi]SET35444.1 Nitroreductase [Oceanobacillus limi]
MYKVDKNRESIYEIDPIYLERWSPRSFQEKEVPGDILNSLFEAARWAPSAGNVQPWRFIVARNKVDREKFLTFIHEGNTIWCKKAPILVAIISKENEERFGGHNKAHAFDAGAAWGYFALEAVRKGLVTHAMGGFNKEEAKKKLEIPEGYAIHAIVAVGYAGEKEALPEQLQQREKPSTRKEIDAFVSEGSFSE